VSTHTSDDVDEQAADEPATEKDGADVSDGPPVLAVTESALSQILELRAEEDDGDTLALRVEITGATGNDFTYDLSFAPIDEAEEGDSVTHQDELPLVVPVDTIVDLRGSTLDLPADSEHGGLVLRNPNKPNPLVGPAVELEGTVEERIRQLLDGSINPALAAHGGFAALLKVEEPQAFVTMGGGCQGCAVSAMTLRDGIQSAIVDNIPEIDEVMDVTDHDAGENPFY
jgi:Fe/S biogenesis protein NfuA